MRGKHRPDTRAINSHRFTVSAAAIKGGGQWKSDIVSRLVPVLHAAGDRSMTLFCGWTKKFSFGLAVLACGHTASANGPFKPASYGQIVDETSSAPVQASPMYDMPMGQYESYPGQYMEPTTCGEYVNGCDMGCGPGGAFMGHQFGGGMGGGHFSGGGEGEGDVCGYCGTPGCTLAGRCIGSGRSIHYFLNSAFMKVGAFARGLTPYGEGGVATTRWFDVQAEMIALGRSKDGRDTAITSLGQTANQIVLSTNDVDQDKLEPGLLMQVNLQVGPGSNIEAVYFGLNKWEERATATGAANLFSFLSQFGTVPLGGFDDTDRSNLQSISLTSQIHNAEVNFRRRWQEPAGFFQGSFLAGVRYFDLDEEFVYATEGQFNNGLNNTLRFSNFNTQTRNQLTGFQMGGDIWWNLLPGIKIGSELKSGIYGNNSMQATEVRANSITNGVNSINALVNEVATDGRTAYLTSFNTQLWYRLSYSWAFKTSFQMIYVDNVALATENLNPVPLAFAAQRAAAVGINNDGEVLYTGYTLGAEYSW